MNLRKTVVINANKLKFWTIVSATIYLCVALNGCRGNQSPKRTAATEVLRDVQLKSEHLQAIQKPQVDILLVVDDSNSMEKHQDDLAQNIPAFVDAFDRKNLVDYHIGVIPIWDSVHLGITTPAPYPYGTLVAIGNPKDSANSAPRFMTRENRNNQLLMKTIKIGTANGPEFEEVFTPVEAALSDEFTKGPNQGFYRPQAHLVVIFITDADDASPNISPDDFYYSLLRMKGFDREKLHFFGVISPIADRNCPRDPSGFPIRLTRFLTISQGATLSLCSKTFGSELAKYAEVVSEEVGRQTIPLPSVPDIRTLRVHFGKQDLPRNFSTGWSYDPSRQVILIGGQVSLQPEPSAQLEIDYTPVSFSNLKNGHATNEATASVKENPRPLGK